MKLTESITKIRKAKGFSQQQIAEILQTTQQQYSKYETGAQEIPVHHIITLSELYKVTTDNLLGITPFMSNEEGNKKFLKLFDQTINILYWATEQDHIDEEAQQILIDNITREKEEIEAE